jgi:GT2 family glycosyltransferase
MIGVILPTRGRYKALFETLSSLNKTEYSDNIELIVVADNDSISYNIAVDFKQRLSMFGKMKVILSEERLYAVKAFDVGFNHLESDIFCWMNDENTYRNNWLEKAYYCFYNKFPDDIGVLSLYKINKAGLGMTSKKFVEHNNGEWFHSGYVTYYPDDELACRAILLGRYHFIPDSGVFHNIKITEEIPIIPIKEKQRQKKVDRSLFYKRSENNFGLNPEKLYPWHGFRNINEALK